jgi:hypothetical protein
MPGIMRLKDPALQDYACSVVSMTTTFRVYYIASCGPKLQLWTLGFYTVSVADGSRTCPQW